MQRFEIFSLLTQHLRIIWCWPIKSLHEPAANSNKSPRLRGLDLHLEGNRVCCVAVLRDSIPALNSDFSDLNWSCVFGDVCVVEEGCAATRWSSGSDHWWSSTSAWTCKSMVSKVSTLSRLCCRWVKINICYLLFNTCKVPLEYFSIMVVLYSSHNIIDQSIDSIKLWGLKICISRLCHSRTYCPYFSSGVQLLNLTFASKQAAMNGCLSSVTQTRALVSVPPCCHLHVHVNAYM